jgi:hypothetical protein
MFGSIAGAVIGGLLSNRGQARANRVNVSEAQKNRDFQSAQNAKQMAFEAEWAQKNMDFQQASVDKQMAFQADWAQKSMDFQKQMSDTSWQRGVQDMRKAGLNPALAYSQGGASGGSGATASGSSASGSSAKGSTSSGSMARVENELAIASQFNQMALQEQQINNAKAQERQINAQTKTINAMRQPQVDKTNAEITSNPTKVLTDVYEATAQPMMSTAKSDVVKLYGKVKKDVINEITSRRSPDSRDIYNLSKGKQKPTKFKKNTSWNNWE